MKLIIYAKPEFQIVRIKKGYSLTSLAKAINVTSQAIGQYERRLAGVSPENSKKILGVLKVDFDEIFELVSSD